MLYIEYTKTRLRKDLYSELYRESGAVFCYVCGKPVSSKDASLEHKKPRSKGGTDTKSNLAISHKKCNTRRGNGEQRGS